MWRTRTPANMSPSRTSRSFRRATGCPSRELIALRRNSGSWETTGSGGGVKAIVSGSATLGEDTQRWFETIGVPLLQVYGLTETTGIVTMDEPRRAVPGRVGYAIPGCETRISDEGELQVRGPNVFPGYWNRPEITAKVLKNGWFYTGDQGETNESGNWKIVGRLKDLIIPSSGHNISPEPIEQMVLRALPAAEQVVAIGNGRKFLSIIVTGNLSSAEIESALKIVNRELPHYKQIRQFHRSEEPFTIESGLLTANRKLKRSLIEARFRKEIEALYAASGQAEKERVSR